MNVFALKLFGVPGCVRRIHTVVIIEALSCSQVWTSNQKGEKQSPEARFSENLFCKSPELQQTLGLRNPKALEVFQTVPCSAVVPSPN